MVLRACVFKKWPQQLQAHWCNVPLWWYHIYLFSFRNLNCTSYFLNRTNWAVASNKNQYPQLLSSQRASPACHTSQIFLLRWRKLIFYVAANLMSGAVFPFACHMENYTISTPITDQNVSLPMRSCLTRQLVMTLRDLCTRFQLASKYTIMIQKQLHNFRKKRCKLFTIEQVVTGLGSGAKGYWTTFNSLLLPLQYNMWLHMKSTNWVLTFK